MSLNIFGRWLVFAVLSVAWILALMAVIVATAPSGADADGGRPPFLADLRPETDDGPAAKGEPGLTLGEAGVAGNHVEEAEDEEEDRRERREGRQREREARKDDRGED